MLRYCRSLSYAGNPPGITAIRSIAGANIGGIYYIFMIAEPPTSFLQSTMHTYNTVTQLFGGFATSPPNQLWKSVALAPMSAFNPTPSVSVAPTISPTTSAQVTRLALSVEVVLNLVLFVGYILTFIINWCICLCF
jgi:hypothetical protein